MNKYHVNQETGRVNICRATEKRGCPLKNVDGTPAEHFTDKTEAKKHYEKSMDTHTLNKLSKNPETNKAEKLVKPKPVDVLANMPKEPIEKIKYLLDNFESFSKDHAYINGERIPAVKSEQEIDMEENELKYDYQYSAKDLLMMRNISRFEVTDNEMNGDYFVTVKVPGSSEVSISSDLARKTLNMPKRNLTNSDRNVETVFRQIRDEMNHSQQGIFDEEQYKERANKLKEFKVYSDKVHEKLNK